MSRPYAIPVDWRPMCMTEAEFADWNGFADLLLSSHGLRKPTICHDCTYSFRRANEAAGTCNKQGTSAAVAERRARVTELRGRGMSWGSIGRMLGITTRQAYDLVRYRRKDAA